MHRYEVYIQNNFYKTIEAEDTDDVLKIVSQDIQDHIPEMDYEQDHQISITQLPEEV